MLDDQKHCKFAMVVHHIMYGGMSLEFMRTEIGAAYQGVMPRDAVKSEMQMPVKQ